MAVDSVNNNSNAGMYAAGGALIGAGAGAAAGWYSRPFLKDGAPTDTFIKKINDNIVETLDEDTKKLYNDSVENLQKLENCKNAEELKAIFRNNDAIKQTGMLDAMLSEIDSKGFEAAKADAKKGAQMVLDMRDDMYKTLFENSWDKNAKKFVHNANEVSKEGFEAIKKAAHSIQGKYAAIYGAVGAAVLGLGTLLCCGGKKEDPQAPVDVQA